MHYEDKEAIKAGKLTVVVYKHTVYDIVDKTVKGFEYSLSSIQHCEYVNPVFINRLYKQADKIFADLLKDEKPEEYYMLKFTRMKRGKHLTCNVSKPKKVSNTRNKLHRLH